MVEVVEVASHLPGRLVEGGDLPALQRGHLLWQRGLLDAPRHPQLLFDPFALAYLLREIFPKLTGFLRAPLLGDLSSGYVVHVDDPAGFLQPRTSQAR